MEGLRDAQFFQQARHKAMEVHFTLSTQTDVHGRGEDMQRVMVRYKVKADRAAENEAYIRNVFAQLERERPAGIRYASFKLDDGVSFVHIASIETPDGTNPLTALDAFKDFTLTIKDRCEEPPVSVTLNESGSYRLLTGD
jgi:hypothetical protein